ncbi:hypothetical protein MP638_004446 [Amoeboaphelidium occidentale]|nr:hypothetical protein MP638_004446 [Amoeboaphelidium occidentale]
MEAEDFYSDSMNVLGLGSKIEDDDDMFHNTQRPMQISVLEGKRSLLLHRVSVEKYAIQSMAHFIWNASLVMLRMIENEDIFVKNKSVVELGSGVGLPGLVCSLMGASMSVITEYPDESIMAVLEKNISVNNINDNCIAMGHAWGCDVTEVLKVNGGNKYDVVLVADCIWMEEQHAVLLESCRNLVKAETGEIYVTCFPHTGKLKIEGFLSMAQFKGFIWQRIQRKDSKSVPYIDSSGKLVDVSTEILSKNESYLLRFCGNK